jgi:RNA recognition motif-containing protein
MFLSLQVQQTNVQLAQNLSGLNLVDPMLAVSGPTVEANKRTPRSLKANAIGEKSTRTQNPAVSNTSTSVVLPAPHKESKPRPVGSGHKIWVGNLPLNVTQLDVSNFFKQWGKITIFRLQ